MHVRTITHDRYVKRFASIREISPADLISKDLLLFLLMLMMPDVCVDPQGGRAYIHLFL